MKQIILYSSIICIGMLGNVVFGQTLNCDSTPSLNKNIIAFVNSKMKKKVGKGECWDLAAQALNTNNALWDKRYKFGKEINYKTDCIYPGDVIQFENVVVKYKQDNKDATEKMTHHTAIIYEVKGTGEFILAHQNTAYSGKKVGTSAFDTKNITKGKFIIYRPVLN